MHLSNSELSLLAVISLAVAALALALAAAGAARGRRPQADTALPQGDRLEMLLENQAKQIQRLEAAARRLAGGERQLAELLQATISHVGVVRFDAFEDMGGRLSFSAALLDGHGNGIVITSINGRQDTRCYAKEVRGGASAHNLSGEEQQAIRDALASSASSGADRRSSPTGEVRSHVQTG